MLLESVLQFDIIQSFVFLSNHFRSLLVLHSGLQDKVLSPLLPPTISLTVSQMKPLSQYSLRIDGPSPAPPATNQMRNVSVELPVRRLATVAAAPVIQSAVRSCRGFSNGERQAI